MNCVSKHKAYKRTDKTLEQKWSEVADELKTHVLFTAYVGALNGTMVKRKYERMEKTVKEKYAISCEGANLSGLPDQWATLWEQSVYNMMCEVIQYDMAKDRRILEMEQRTKLEQEKLLIERRREENNASLFQLISSLQHNNNNKK